MNLWDFSTWTILLIFAMLAAHQERKQAPLISLSAKLSHCSPQCQSLQFAKSALSLLFQATTPDEPVELAVAFLNYCDLVFRPYETVCNSVTSTQTESKLLDVAFSLDWHYNGIHPCIIGWLNCVSDLYCCLINKILRLSYLIVSCALDPSDFHFFGTFLVFVILRRTTNFALLKSVEVPGSQFNKKVEMF